MATINKNFKVKNGLDVSGNTTVSGTITATTFIGDGSGLTNAGVTSYNDLTDKPTIVTSYNDLTDKPSIPSLTGYATESYVNTQVANLVDSSPSTLNTLNELAAALGDDANFATTITNSLATKLDYTDLANGSGSGFKIGLDSSYYGFQTETTRSGIYFNNTVGFIKADYVPVLQWDQSKVTIINANFGTDSITLNGITGSVTSSSVTAGSIATTHLTLQSIPGEYGQIISSYGFAGAHWTNLKTINGESLLGSGNIAVFSGNYNDLTNVPTSAFNLITSNVTQAVSSYDAVVNSIVIGRSGGNKQSNTALGRNALIYNSTGQYNVAIGELALFANTTGYSNTSIGYYSLYANETGINNTALGSDSLRLNKGSSNTAIGSATLSTNTTGFNNTALGSDSLRFNSTGNYNTAVGSLALNNTTSSNNSALGYRALYTNTTGNFNTSVGSESLRQNTLGSSNTAVGTWSLQYNTEGGNNTAVGKQTLYSNTTGSSNTSVGVGSLRNNTTGYYNLALGESALYYNTLGFENTAVGKGALGSQTTGNKNTAIGNISGNVITTGSSNTILGSFTGNQNGLDIRTESNYIVLSDGDGWPGLIIKNGVGTTLKSVASGSDTNILNYNSTTGAVTYESKSSLLNTTRTLIATSGNALNTNIDCGGYSTLEIFYRPYSVSGIPWLIFKDDAATPAGLTQNYQVSRYVGTNFGGTLTLSANNWSSAAAGELMVAGYAYNVPVQQDGNYTSAIHLRITGWGTNTVTIVGTGYVQGTSGFGDWNTVSFMTSTSNLARYITLKQDTTNNGVLRIWGYK